MPRIRKKTSKRVAIHKREKLKKKVKDGRKKKDKKAKKDTQWKSKHPKDPGIPNNFPYKDQILAEVAEQRRLAAEEKQRRKDEKKAAKSRAEGSDAEHEDEDEIAFDGVRAIAAKRALGGPSAGENDDEDVGMEGEADEKEDIPVLVNPDLPNLKAVLDAADVVVEVLDARDPLSSRSAHVEEVALELKKKVVLVLNKVDACPREAVEAWATALKREHPTVLFRSATACLPVTTTADVAKNKGKGKEKERTDDAWGLDAVTSLLEQWASDKKGDEPLTVAVVGMSNTGKTSFVNSLLGKAALQMYKLSASTDSPTTTTHPQEVTVDLGDGRALRVIDVPGFSWHTTEDVAAEEWAQTRARDMLLRSRGRMERLKDPSSVMSEIISRANREDLMLAYNLPIFPEGDANAFLTTLARANGFIKKKGEPDVAGAARTILRDWASGKFARYTVPATSPSSLSPSAPSDVPPAGVYAKDETVLSKLSSRKDLRKTGGLVKLRTGTVDTRKLLLDASYFVASDDEGDENDEEDASTVSVPVEVGFGGEEDEDEDEDEDEEEEDELDEDTGEEEEEEEYETPPPYSKRKRALAKAPTRPAKRVAFAPEPKGTKQARSAAGAKGAQSKGKKSADNGPESKPTQKPKKAGAAKPAIAKRVANASSMKSAASSAKDGEVAYNFTQFF